MSVSLRGGIYHYRRMINGKLYRGSTEETTKPKAEQFEIDLIGRIKQGLVNPAIRKVPKLDDFSVPFLQHIDAKTAAGNLEEKTRVYYHNGVRLLAGIASKRDKDQTPKPTTVWSMRLDEIDDEVCQELAFPGGPSNANNAIRTLRHILHYSVAKKILRAAPNLSLKDEPGRDAVLAPWSEDLLLKHASPVLHDVMIMMLDAGPRPEEVREFRWENINLLEGDIFIPDGKTVNARRHIGITDRMRNVLAAARARAERQAKRWHTEVSPWVFPSLRAASGHVENFSQVWGRMIKRVEKEIAAKRLPPLPPGLVLYSCRHTYATNYLDGGGHIGTLMLLLGHDDIRTTQKYLHPNTKDSASVMNRHNEKAATRIHLIA